LQAILDFSLNKINNAVFDIGDGEQTPEDHAQEVAIYIWSHLKDFRGEPGTFYSWLHRICYTTGSRAFNEAKEQVDERVALQVQDEETGLMEDNPLLYTNQFKGEPARKLPTWIQGIDKAICDYIREGLTYEQIARVLRVSPTSISSRVLRLKKKVEFLAQSKAA
jgi:RNA polymerase sigma factor (sigma-70 family)